MHQAEGHRRHGVAKVLMENGHLLPTRGRALDLAAGLGSNSLFLAGKGLEVSAWDVSAVAAEELRRRSAVSGLPVVVEVRDVVSDPPSPRSFDVIVVVHFLDRRIAGRIAEALRPGGLLYYQTFTQTRVNEIGPHRSEYRLADNELLHMFGQLQVLVYREEGAVGDIREGFRNEALLVARRIGE